MPLQLIAFLILVLTSCSPRYTNLDKQSDLFVSQALGLGASGAITAIKLGNPAAIGAGVGLATAGLLSSIQSFAVARVEESLLKLESDAHFLLRSAVGQQILVSYLDIKRQYHPNRDIFPASLFFHPDSTTLTFEGQSLLTEIYNLNKDRAPWSRFGVISYVTTSDKNNEYSNDLVVRQTKEIGNYLLKLGLNPRRITLLGAFTNRPIVNVPPEIQSEYFNCIEFVPLDLVISEQNGDE